MKRLSEEPQALVIYKINPNKQERNGDVPFDRSVDGRILYGYFNILENNLVVISEMDEIIGVFSLNHYYFLHSKH